MRIAPSPRVRGTAYRHSRSSGESRFIPACAGNRPLVRSSRCGWPVHPRVCGEQNLPVAIFRVHAGSSPRVRGTDDSRLARSRIRRFIPACAGNRAHLHDEPGGVSVHPRVCGEQSVNTTVAACTAGSSPRVRGTGIRFAHRARSSRFIPACAGNRIPPARRSRSTAVHPRVCGEQKIAALASALGCGSSPRVRGTE